MPASRPAAPDSSPAPPAPPRPDPVQPADDTARALALRLLREARYAALATLDPETGDPMASRVIVTLDTNGLPLLQVSALSAHTTALAADPRCSLLLGEPGAGDPLAHPRLTLVGRAESLPRGSDAAAQARERWLLAHPKSALYIDFADFGFWRITPRRGLLNGGFGRAYRLDAADLIVPASS